MKNGGLKKSKFFKQFPIYLRTTLYIFLLVLVVFELLNIYSQFYQLNQYPFKSPHFVNPTPIKYSQEKTETITPKDLVAENSEEWGKARQIDEYTWTIKVGQDKHMGTPPEILMALNTYRTRHGSPTLQPDEKLSNYAQSRADHFETIKATDKHSGFSDFINNQNGFEKLGFNAVGENSSYGFHVEGVHLIEWVYAGDEPHNKNQLNPEWSHVGIGVNNVSTNLIFGAKKQ